MPKPTRQGNTIYCIVHVESGEFCSFGSKIAWISISAAKNAFQCHVKEYSKGYGTSVKIEDQDEYEIIEVNN